MVDIKCELCKEENYKYKCPKCLIKYCSVKCFKVHKETPCGASPEDKPPPEAPPEKKQKMDDTSQTQAQDMPTVAATTVPTVTPASQAAEDAIHDLLDLGEDTHDRVSQDQLRLLENSGELRAMLENPHLQTLMTSIDRGDNKARHMAKAMKEPIFTEFADECLRIVMDT